MEYGSTAHIRGFLRHWAGDQARDALLELKPLHGGLETSQVALVTARYADAASRNRVLRFVMKQLEGRSSREVVIRLRPSAVMQ